MEPTIVFRDDRVCAATWGAVFFEIWYGPATPAHFRVLRTQQVSHARSQPAQKSAHFTVVLLTSFPALDREMRAAVDERTRVMMAHMLVAVVVIPVQGFVASIVRSTLAGASLLQRRNYSSTVCASVEDGCGWVAPHLLPVAGRPVAPADVRRACAALMARGPHVGALAG